MIRRPLPWVFRYSATLLIVAAIAGAWLQGQPAGVVTRLLIHRLSQRCPAMTVVTTPLTVADGAHAIDRVALAILLDRLSPRRISRCDGRSRNERAGERGRRSRSG